MFVSVMVVFAVYALIFIVFEDYDRKFLKPFDEVSDWHLLLFSLVVMTGLAFLLHRYARRMDERISREQAAKENQMRRGRPLSQASSDTPILFSTIRR